MVVNEIKYIPHSPKKWKYGDFKFGNDKYMDVKKREHEHIYALRYERKYMSKDLVESV
jgi:hypothetical protein